jgi:hypothetical protein
MPEMEELQPRPGCAASPNPPWLGCSFGLQFRQDADQQDLG